jgi:isoquinoline 1-oxidoreductase beta subunit
MTIRAFGERPRHISRRGLLIGGGAGVGLLLAWTVWPRTFAPNLVASPGEVVLNGYVKVANTGQITVAVPEMETGQGAYTLFAQIVADELGADWRTVGVEAAPINPLYGNEAAVAGWPGLTPATPFSPPPPQLTDEAFAPSTFETQARNAGAAARALLCMAAAKRWGADWQACETENGFVVLGNDRLSFADLAEEAADHEIPDTLPLRSGRENRLLGQSVPRIDAPAKIDGSANFAADVRLPGMVYAAVRAGPLGDTRFTSMDEARATQSRDVLHVLVVHRRSMRMHGGVAAQESRVS